MPIGHLDLVICHSLFGCSCTVRALPLLSSSFCDGSGTSHARRSAQEACDFLSAVCVVCQCSTPRWRAAPKHVVRAVAPRSITSEKGASHALHAFEAAATCVGRGRFHPSLAGCT